MGDGKEAQEGGDICMYIANSLCCTAETNTILQRNYTPIKQKFTKTTSSESQRNWIKYHFKESKIPHTSYLFLQINAWESSKVKWSAQSGKDFLAVTPKVPSTKDKIEKLSLIKIRNFSSSKDTIKKMKKQAKGWENISLRCNTYLIKGLYPEFTENSCNSIIDKQSNQNEWSKVRTEDAAKNWDLYVNFMI